MRGEWKIILPSLIKSIKSEFCSAGAAAGAGGGRGGRGSGKNLSCVGFFCFLVFSFDEEVGDEWFQIQKYLSYHTRTTFPVETTEG